MSQSSSTPSSPAWTAHAAALALAGQSPAEIATQLGKTLPTVTTYLSSPAFLALQQVELTRKHGTLRAAVDYLLRQSAVPVIMNLIRMAQGEGQNALRAIQLVIPHIFGDNQTGLNLDIQGEGPAAVVEKLRQFFKQNPAIASQVLAKPLEGSSPATNDENSAPPEVKPSNVIPIRSATMSSRGGAPSDTPQAAVQL